MGTWDAGPFGNDAALDYVGDVIGSLMRTINEFIESPEIDETFDPAFAALAILNEVMEVTPCRPWTDDGTVDPDPICSAFIGCFDSQIADMDPEPEFERVHRAALVAALDRFRAHLA